MEKRHKQVIDVIIISGGDGYRIKELTNRYLCKSLIPINKIPCVFRLISSIRKVLPNSRILLCIDSKEKIAIFKKFILKFRLRNLVIFQDKHRGPVQTIYEAGALCETERVLIFFGNQLVPQKHILNLVSYGSESAVFSTYDKTSENHCKIAVVSKESIITAVSRHNYLKKIKRNERYIDVPYCLPIKFFSMETFPTLKKLFVKDPMRTTKLKKDEKVYSLYANFPSEFHYKYEVDKLKTFFENVN